MYKIIVGTYANKSGGLHVCQFDDTGISSISQGLATKENLSYLCSGEDNRYFYVAAEQDSYGRVYVCTEDNNTIKICKTYSLDCKGLCHILHNNVVLYGSCYISGDMIVVDKDNSVQYNKFSDENNVSHYHSTCLSNDGRYLLCADLGRDTIYVNRIDNQKSLESIHVNSISLPKGSGPRDILFLKSKSVFYVTLELGSKICAYEFCENSGKARLIDTYDLKGQYKGENYPSNMCITTDDQHLFIANRGKNVITAFQIDCNGFLCKSGEYNCLGDWPRHITLTKDNKYLICSNQKSDNVVIFKNKGLALDLFMMFDVNSPACSIQR